MISTGLLILTSPPRILVTKIKHYLTIAKNRIESILYIKIEPGAQKLWPISRKPLTPTEQRMLYHLIPQIYREASLRCSELDVRVLQSGAKVVDATDQHVRRPFEIVLSEITENVQEYLTHQFGSDCTNIHTVECDSSSEIGTDDNVTPVAVWDNVVIGGTFDRLHNGHKVLLSEAILRCRNRLTVGITDGIMLHKKTLWELIEPLDIRIRKLREFMNDVDPTVTYNIVPIYDPFGPSTEEEDLNAIVVSQETLGGGKAVNEKRLEKNMNTLATYVIPVIEDPERCEQEEAKISSSSGRMRLLGSQLRPPETRLNRPPRPYLIGLTGGIASGKSAIGKRLQKLGAGLVDCDRLAHQSYAPNSELSLKLAQEFGNDVLTVDGAVDRKILGSKVFGNEDARQKLNSLVWPEVRRLADSQVQEHFMNGCSVVVLEAALLLEADWKNYVHQVWVSIIPEAEAVQRIENRDKLTKDEALRRIRSQITNSERVAQANVVFSTMWDPVYTQKQVEKAWANLQNILSSDGHEV